MAIELLPDLSTKCSPLPTGPGELCIVLPGGARICASDGVETGDSAEIVKGLLAQLMTAAAPLQPFFNVLDVLKCIFDCIQAIPEAILSLNPEPIVSCIVNLSKAIDKLIQLFPQVSVPLLVASALVAVIEGIIGIRLKLLAIIRQAQRVSRALEVAAATGNEQLQRVADCAQENLQNQMANVNAAFAPLNRLIGVLNVLLEMAGLPCIPGVGSIPSPDDDGLAALDAIVATLEAVKATLPLPANLPALPGAGECP